MASCDESGSGEGFNVLNSRINCFIDMAVALCLKGIVQPKIKILSLITHPQVVPNPSASMALVYFEWSDVKR